MLSKCVQWELDFHGIRWLWCHRIDLWSVACCTFHDTQYFFYLVMVFCIFAAFDTLVEHICLNALPVDILMLAFIRNGNQTWCYTTLIHRCDLARHLHRPTHLISLLSYVYASFGLGVLGEVFMILSACNACLLDFSTIYKYIRMFFFQQLRD